MENDAYAARFTEDPMTYISDSLMKWRQATPHALIAQRRSFQLLIHPMKWAHDGVHNMHDALARARDAEQQALTDEYVKVEQYYAELLERRAELDARFRERRRR